MKLVSKTRVGSKARRKYDTAQTPYQRILASPHIHQEVKEQLRQLYLILNPVALQRRINAPLEQLWALEK